MANVRPHLAHPLRCRHNTLAVTRQRGVSLLIVLVLIMLSMLLALGGSRTAILNEAAVGNDSDYQRAYEAAQALVRDAELDIRGRNAAGVTPCGGTSVGCRNDAVVFFPENLVDFQNLQAALTAPWRCTAGICMDLANNTTTPNPALNFATVWDNPAQVAALWPLGASYGQFTGAAPGATGNAVLAAGTGRYWVEVLRYDTAAVSSNAFGDRARQRAPDIKNGGLIYRITAMARGTKPGTEAVIQTLFVKDPPTT